MTIQHLVSPENIESELFKIWEELAKENKMRASLFNLIVLSKPSKRTDYIRKIVQKVIEKFPCRTIFITDDAENSTPYLKTAISVLMLDEKESTIACDLIDVGVSGSEINKVPSLILPHLLPDLPIYVLWAEDPSANHSLFDPLVKLADRMIFDSESAEHLLGFAKTLLDLHQKRGLEIADLNWARTLGWRELVTSLFKGEHQVEHLQSISSIRMSYNSRESDFFCHLKIQSMYLLAWLSSRLKWKVEQADPNLKFRFLSPNGPVEAQVESTAWEKLGSGTIISVELEIQNGYRFQAGRIPDRYHYVKVLSSSSDVCQLPYEYVLGQTATGQSLVQEICIKGTSSHYIDMLQELLILDKDILC